MYFCKNCGEQYSDDKAAVCLKCGVFKTMGDKYCHNCGNALNEGDLFCTACGVEAVINNSATENVVEDTTVKKSKILAGILGIFFGCFGVHNFYLGYTGKAIAQLLITILSCFMLYWVSAIWGLIEGILILTGSTITTDANGVPLTQ
jgi:TM2 domain-containing membrane protein YozV